MSVDDLAAEEAALRERLRSLENDVHTRLRADERANEHAIEVAEREIRKIVLRLVAVERERIERSVAESL